MTLLAEPKINLVHEAITKESASKYILSIKVSLDGFTYCVFDYENKKNLSLQSFSFQDLNDYYELCRKIDEITNNIYWLKYPFKSVNIVFNNQRSTLIPNPLFDDAEKHLYLNFNQDFEKGESVEYDRLKLADACNIYTIPHILKSKLKLIFKSCRIRHFSSTFIESILHQHNQNNGEQLFISVQRFHLNLVVLKDKQFLFHNSFHFQTIEEFIYYILFVLDQLKINKKVSTTLLGDIDQNIALFDEIKKVLKNVKFGKIHESLKMGNAFKDFPVHCFHNLLSIYLCE